MSSTCVVFENDCPSHHMSAIEYEIFVLAAAAATTTNTTTTTTTTTNNNNSAFLRY